MTGKESDSLRAAFDRDGYVVAPLFGPAEVGLIRAFALDWVGGLMQEANGGPLRGSLADYHKWGAGTAINHGAVLAARNRHRAPQGEIRDVLLGESVWQALRAVAPDADISDWDEGLGWVGFRLVRPGHGDGYPWSCKAWGPAKTVLSLWIPVIGHGPNETIALWPGSHRQEHKSYLPENSKFTKDELRLETPPKPGEIVRPVLAPGEAVIFGPRTIHSEDVEVGEVTRLNLEMRFATTRPERPAR